MFNRITTLLVLALLSSCASVHPGKMGVSKAKDATLPIKISAENIEPDKDSPYQIVDITIENTSNDWLRIDKGEMLIDDADLSKVSVVLGDDLKYWAEAEQQKAKEHEHNKKLVQLGLLGAGVVAAVAGSRSGNAGLQTAGAVVTIGTYGWVLKDAIDASIKKVNNTVQIPENHFYHSVSIPAKSHLRRWILINKPVGTLLSKMTVQVDTVSGEKEAYDLAL